MDLLRSYELYELLQLYIVSEVAITANSNQLYAALFTSLPPKPIDLGLVKQKYNKLTKDGNEAVFLKPKIIFDLFKAKLDALKTKIELEARIDNTESFCPILPPEPSLPQPSPSPIETPLSPPQDSNASSDIHFFEDLVTTQTVEKYRQTIDSQIINSKKVMEQSHTCKDTVGPYCGTFELEEDHQLHQKLWHSNYVYTTCPYGCQKRFLGQAELKGHRAICTKQAPEFDQEQRQSKKPSRFSPDALPRRVQASTKPRLARVGTSAALVQPSPTVRPRAVPSQANSKSKPIATKKAKVSEVKLKINCQVHPDDVPLIDVLREKENKAIPKILITRDQVQPPPTQTKYPKLTLAEWEKNMHPATCKCTECTSCSVCSDTFDTKRGLIIHFTRLHRDKIKEPESIAPAQKKGYRNPKRVYVGPKVTIDKVARYFNSSNSSNSTILHKTNSSAESIAIKEEAVIVESQTLECSQNGPWCALFNTASVNGF